MLETTRQFDNSTEKICQVVISVISVLWSLGNIPRNNIRDSICALASTGTLDRIQCIRPLSRPDEGQLGSRQEGQPSFFGGLAGCERAWKRSNLIHHGL